MAGIVVKQMEQNTRWKIQVVGIQTCPAVYSALLKV